MPLRVRADEKTTLEILRRGIFDLAVTETLFRLADPAEVAVDVGANVGYMASVLAVRVGREGKVIMLEPHPRICADLRANIGLWERVPNAPCYAVHESAASGEAGSGRLRMDEQFDWNQGSATLSGQQDDVTVTRAVEIDARPLDEILGSRQVGVLKVDVEGYELEVFKGAEQALRGRRIRDVVFEDFEEAPTATARLLERWGYSVFALDHGLFGPVVKSGTQRAARRSGSDPSYLATIHPDRALARLRRRGWRTLAGPGPGPSAGTARHG